MAMPQPIQAPPSQPQPPPGADPEGDPRNLHDLALDIQTDLHKLAVGLAHAGAAPEAVAQLTKMAEVISNVVKVLGAGGGEGAPPGPGAPAGAPPQGAPPPAASPQADAPAAAKPPDNMQSASQQLHDAMIASAAAHASSK